MLPEVAVGVSVGLCCHGLHTCYGLYAHGLSSYGVSAGLLVPLNVPSLRPLLVLPSYTVTLSQHAAMAKLLKVSVMGLPVVMSHWQGWPAE